MNSILQGIDDNPIDAFLGQEANALSQHAKMQTYLRVIQCSRFHVSISP
jgi:hypothetical protein